MIQNKILCTGINGFIGKNVARYLNKLGYNIFSLGRSQLSDNKNHFAHCDLNEIESVQRVINEVQPDIVLHFAANPIVRHNLDKPNDLLNTNIIGTNNLLHCLKEGTRVIFASSIVVYDEGKFLHDERCPIKVKSLYGTSKIACEALLQSYKEYKNINYTIVRLGATIGAGLTHGLIFDILRKLKSDSSTLELLGNKPGSVKPFTYISDVISAVKILLHEGPELVNVCVHDPISVEDVANIVMKVLDIKKDIIWNPANWPGDNKKLHAYCGIMRSLGWKPYYTSEEAVAQTIKEYIKEYGSNIVTN